MKKMIVMLAAVAMAACAQAASVTWTAVDANAKGVYMFDAPQNNQDYVERYWADTREVMIETLIFDTWEAQLSELLPFDAFDAQGSGTFTYTARNQNIYGIIVATYDDANVTPGGRFNAYLVDASKVEANTFDLSKMTPYQSGNFGGGAAGNIPEPTSGLLLLLGMAGLALKRKVA